MRENERIAIEFAEKYNGKIVGVIDGNKILKSGKKSRAGYKIMIDGHMVHSYYIRVWHRNRDSISVSVEQLQNALDENALMLVNQGGKEFVMHSTQWELDAKATNNYDRHTRFRTHEVFAERLRFRKLDLDKFKIHQYFPDED